MNQAPQHTGDAAMKTEASASVSPLVRAEGYRLLAAAFGYPDVDEFSTLFREAASVALATDQAQLASLAGRLLAAVDSDLAGEYNRLFSQSVAVTPYETSYVAADKGVQLGRLAALMEAFGVRSRGEERESPDHIGSELEFMAFLCVKEASHQTETRLEGQEAYAAVRQAQALFVQEHVGVWAPVFADRLRSATRHPFYALLADVLPAWLEQERASQGFRYEPLASRVHLPLLQPDGSTQSTIATGEVEDDAMICPMATPTDDSEGTPIHIG